MKKILYVLLLGLLFIPIKASALNSFTYSDIKNKVNTEIAKYSNYYDYFVLSDGSNIVKYIYNNKTLSSNSNFQKGGLLNLFEYNTIGNKKSYLYDANKYWMMTESDSNNTYIVDDSTNGYSISSNINPNGFRLTEYIGKDIKVTGTGSYINPWKFIEITKVPLIISDGGEETSPYLRTTIIKNSIESITFMNTKKVPFDAIGSFDVSSNNSGKVMLWYKDIDSDSLYEVFIGSNGGVMANPISSYLFYGLTKLTSIDFTYFDTSSMTETTHMFHNAKSLTELDLSNFDTSNVTKMDSMFTNASSLTSLDLSSFNTSNVTRMNYMFLGANSIRYLNVSSFDTSNVTTMYSMFDRMYSVTSLDLSNFDTSKVTTMYSMFNDNQSLTSLDLSNFDTSKVTTMEWMFFNNNSLNYLNIDNFNTSQVTNMRSMFYNLRSLPLLNVSSFDTSKVTNMEMMFASDKSLKELNLNSFNTSSVTNMSGMFANTIMTTLDLSSFDTSNVTNMLHMFRSNVDLTTLDMRNANFSKVTSSEEMFYNKAITIYVKDTAAKNFINPGLGMPLLNPVISG